MREIALVVREVMDELGLASFPKTSGATGLHILAPIRPELRFPRRARASRRRSPRRSSAGSATSASRRRPGASPTAIGVFVDFGQNARDRTIACAYSVRPIADARVSAPLRWDEVADVDPAAFTLETMRARLAEAGDPMRGDVAAGGLARPRFARSGCRAGRSSSALEPLAARRERLTSVRSGARRKATRRPRPRPRGRAELAPGAVARVLVVAPAQQLRPVAEAVALHLVVAHLDHELGPDARLLELAAAPAVRLGEVPARGRPRRAAARFAATSARVFAATAHEPT